MIKEKYTPEIESKYITELKELISNYPRHWKSFLNKKSDLLNFIFYKTNKLDYSYNLQTRLVWIFDNLTDFPKCSVCGKSILKPIKNISKNTHYPKCCSHKCAMQQNHVREKLSNTKRNIFANYKPIIKKYSTDEFLKLKNELYDFCKNHKKQFVEQLYHTHTYLLDFIESTIPEQIKNYKITTKINWILTNRTDFPICPICKKQYGFNRQISVFGNYSKTCSFKCAQNLPETIEKRENTCLKNYGTKTPFENPDVRKRWSDNMYEKHQCYHNWAKGSMRDKENEKFQELWNSNTFFTTKEFQKKKTETQHKKYNGILYVQSELFSKVRYKPIEYNGIKFDSKPEVEIYKWCEQNLNKNEFEYQPLDGVLEYEFNGKKHITNVDFKICGKLVEYKGKQFIKDDGTWFLPWKYKEWTNDEYKEKCDLYEAKHQCCIKNNVIIISDFSKTYLQTMFKGL